MSDTDDALDERDDTDVSTEQEITLQELESSTEPPTGNRGRGPFGRLYHGETRINIVGRWKAWFLLSALVIGLGGVALAKNGLNLGIDFTGGTVWRVPAGDATVTEVQDAMSDLGYEDVQVQEVTQSSGADKGRFIVVEAEATADPSRKTTRELEQTERQLQSLANDAPGSGKTAIEDVKAQLEGIDGPFRTDVPEPLTTLQKQIKDTRTAMNAAKTDDGKARRARSGASEMQKSVTQLSDLEQAERQRVGRAVSKELAKITGSPEASVTVDTVGPSWGKQISEKARSALIVFLIAITLYITARFEFRMALATLAALIHDILVVIGLYALFGFPVTPATVIALLTILGFSIYDGIVVFDRVDENARVLGKRSKVTYTEMANTSLNQVLMRSLNTSITALLPITSILVIGSLVLGATTLEEFGLALFLGLLSGAYSSIFIATPILALLKEREPKYRAMRERVLAARELAGQGDGPGTPAGVAASDEVALVAPPGAAPRPRKQGKKR